MYSLRKAGFAYAFVPVNSLWKAGFWLAVACAWKTLYEAAKVQQFEPIMKLASGDMTKVSDVLYHGGCRSDFTHKKTVSKLTDPILTQMNRRMNNQGSKSARRNPIDNHVYV